MHKNILIFPANSENALELKLALQDSIHFTVYGGSSTATCASHFYSEYINDIPFIQDDKFCAEFCAKLIAHTIDLIFTTHEDVLLRLAELRAKLPAIVVGGSFETAQVCRNKHLMYEIFKDERFCPHCYVSDQVKHFPVFCKPSEGQGTVNAFAVNSSDELHRALAVVQNPVLQEFLPGEECSVDCFTDRFQRLRFAGVRSRERVRSGVSTVSRTRSLTPEIYVIAEKINARMQFRGLWFFQIKKDAAGEWKLLEFSSRASSNIGLYRQRGVNLPLLTAFDALDLNVDILDNAFDALLCRNLQATYSLSIEYDTVYIDYDDTLVSTTQVNETVMRFLYQCVNNNLTIVLLTRHEGDLYADMKNKKIAPNLFDRIHHLSWDDEKYTYIHNAQAIFIDNHFEERKKVFEQKQIPVFDVDAVASLITAC